LNLIWEFETYSYDQDAPEKETPLKENDHALDALRYAIYSDEPYKKEIFVKSTPYIPQSEYEGSQRKQFIAAPYEPESEYEG
jgi:hypothetical protein